MHLYLTSLFLGLVALVAVQAVPFDGAANVDCPSGRELGTLRFPSDKSATDVSPCKPLFIIIGSDMEIVFS
jgi:hypothetical protein